MQDGRCEGAALSCAVLANAPETVDALLRAGAGPTIATTVPRTVKHAVVYMYLTLPAGSTPATTAELVGATAAAERLASSAKR